LIFMLFNTPHQNILSHSNQFVVDIEQADSQKRRRSNDEDENAELKGVVLSGILTPTQSMETVLALTEAGARSAARAANLPITIFLGQTGKRSKKKAREREKEEEEEEEEEEDQHPLHFCL
jgi:hypothetical protein